MNYRDTSGWMTGVDLWPAITYIPVGMCLVHVLSPSSYTNDDLLNYRSLNFVSCFVREVLVKVLDEKRTTDHKSITLLQVNHSQKLNEKPLTPWVIAEGNGKIISAHCNCVAGLGECCSHVASLLWAVESGVRMRDSMTVTDKKAYWVGIIKKVPNAQIKKMNFKGGKTVTQQGALPEGHLQWFQT